LELTGDAPSAAMQEPQQTQKMTFHRRSLPAPAIEFSSVEGQKIFAEALTAGTMGCFFRLIEQFHTQSEPAYCGLGTLTMVLNALNVDPGKTWKGPWRWFHEDMLDCCEPLDVVKERGITWPSFLCLARCNGAHIDARRADEAGGDLQAFRSLVLAATTQVAGCAREDEHQPLKVLVVSYSRKQFRQTGDGHYSPIGGYHAQSDRILVLDVARFKHPPHWVPLAEMHESMKRIDGDTGRSRGFALFMAGAPEGTGWLSLIARAHCCGLERPCCGPAAVKLEDVTRIFTAEVGAALRAAPERDARAAAGAVLRRALALCESSHMPFAVMCHDASAAADASVTAERVAQERFERARTLHALSMAAVGIDALLGLEDNLGTPKLPQCTGLDCPDGGALEGAVLRAAVLLSLDTSLWERALLLDSVDGNATGPEREAGAAVWAVLEPLLDNSNMPSPLPRQVAWLRAQWLDLLTDRREAKGGNNS